MLQIDLFGQFDVRKDGEAVAGLEARKAQELLAFLLIQRNRAYSREYLAELLWGHRAPVQSKKYLRQILWQVQSALAEHDHRTGEAGVLTIDGEWVRANEHSHVWLDVAAFEDAYVQAEGMAGGELDSEQAASLRQAAQLYRGDLLEGCYEDWCIYERERFQAMYLAMLDKLIDCCQEHGQYEAGLGYGTTILRYDRARERTHRRMMRLYYLAGDRTSALRQYDQLVRALREELDVKPSRRSVMLRDEIRADRLDAMPPGPPAGSTPDASVMANAASTGPANARSHLRHLHQSLLTMQRQIRQEIEAIELALAES